MTVDVEYIFKQAAAKIRGTQPVPQPVKPEAQLRLDEMLPGLYDALRKLGELAPEFKFVLGRQGKGGSHASAGYNEILIYTTIPHADKKLDLPSENDSINIRVRRIHRLSHPSVKLVRRTGRGHFGSHQDECDANDYASLIEFVITKLSERIHEAGMASAPRMAVNPNAPGPVL